MNESEAELVAQLSRKTVNPHGLDVTGERSRSIAVFHGGDLLVPVFSSPMKHVWGSTEDLGVA